MDGGVLQQSPSDPQLVEDVVNRMKSQGVFDNLRKECLADVDTKPAFQNLRQRVESYVAKFLEEQTWSPDLNKNQLRDGLRKQINQSGMLASGVDRIIDQVIQPKIFKVFKPEINKAMCEVLGVDPKQREEDEKKRQDLLVKYQQQQSFLQKNAQQLQQQGFQGQMQQQFFQGNAAGGMRPPGVPNTNFPPPMMHPQGFSQFPNQQGLQTVQTPRGPVPLMQINAQQNFLNMQQNFNQANMQTNYQNILMAHQQQALVRAGLQSLGMSLPQQNLVQSGIMQQANIPGVPGMSLNQFNPQLALATSTAQQLALQTSQTQFGLPRPVMPSTSGVTSTTFSPMTTSSPRAQQAPVTFSGGVTPGTPVITASTTPGTPSLTVTASPLPSQSPALPQSPARAESPLPPPPPLPPEPDADKKIEKPKTPEPVPPKEPSATAKPDTKSKDKTEKSKAEKKSNVQLPFAVKQEKSRQVKEGSLSRDSPKLEKMKRLKDGGASRSSPTLEKVKRDDSSRESSPKQKHIREGSSSRESPKSDSVKKSSVEKYKDLPRSDKLGHEIKLKKEGLKATISGEKMKQKEERLRILGEKVERKLQQKQESREKVKEKDRLSSGKVIIGDRVLGPKVPSVTVLPAEGKVMIGDRVLGPKIPSDEKHKLKSISDRDRLKYIEKQKIPGGEKYAPGAERLKDSERKMLAERSLEKHKLGEKYPPKLKHDEKMKMEFSERSKLLSADRKGEKLRLLDEKRKSFDAEIKNPLKSLEKSGVKKSKLGSDIKRERADSEPKRPKEIPLEKVRPAEDPRLKDMFWGRDEERVPQKERYVEGHRTDHRSGSKERRKTTDSYERVKHSSKESHGERRKNLDSPEYVERRPSKSGHEKKEKRAKKGEKSEKKYDFAWNKIKTEQLSDISVSSVHTSDLSSFEYDLSDFETDTAELNKRKKEAGLPIKPEPSTSKEPPQPLGGDYEPLSESEDEGVYKEEPPLEPPKPVKKVNSEREKERQRRRSEIEAKLRELDARKRQLQAECRKLKQVEKAKGKEGKVKEDQVKKEDVGEVKSPLKKTKQELKEHLREQKVFEKKMALRRQRAPNKRYTSEEFTSIFSEGQKFYKETHEREIISSSSTSSRSRSATPTQDEQVYPTSGKTATKSNQNIPVYEVTSQKKVRPVDLPQLFPGGNISPVAPLSLKDDDYYEKISSGDSILNSPNSDISEAKSDDFLDESPEKPEKKPKSVSPVTVEIEHKRVKSRPETPVGTTEKHAATEKYAATGKHASTEKHTLAEKHASMEKHVSAEKHASMEKHGATEKHVSTEKHTSKTPPLSGPRSSASRYDLSDLYKPRTSHRRGSPVRSAVEDVPPVKVVKEETPKIQIKEEKVHKEKKKVEKASPPKPDAAKPKSKHYEESDLYKPRLTFLSSGRRRNISGRSLTSKATPDMASAPEKEFIDAHRVFSSRPSTPELTIDELAESMTGSMDSRPSTPGFRPKTPPGEPPADDDEEDAAKPAAEEMETSDVVVPLGKEVEMVGDAENTSTTMIRSEMSTPTMDEPQQMLNAAEAMEVDEPVSSPKQMEDRTDRDDNTSADAQLDKHLEASSPQQEQAFPIPSENVELCLAESQESETKRLDDFCAVAAGEKYLETEQGLSQGLRSRPQSGEDEIDFEQRGDIDSETSNLRGVPTVALPRSEQFKLIPAVSVGVEESADEECVAEANEQDGQGIQGEDAPQFTQSHVTAQMEFVDNDQVIDSDVSRAMEGAVSAVDKVSSTLDSGMSALDILAASALAEAGSLVPSGDTQTRHEREQTGDILSGITLVDTSGKTEFCTVGDEPGVPISDQTRPKSESPPNVVDSETPLDDEDISETASPGLPPEEKEGMQSLDESEEVDENYTTKLKVEHTDSPVAGPDVTASPTDKATESSASESECVSQEGCRSPAEHEREVSSSPVVEPLLDKVEETCCSPGLQVAGTDEASCGAEVEGVDSIESEVLLAETEGQSSAEVGQSSRCEEESSMSAGERGESCLPGSMECDEDAGSVGQKPVERVEEEEEDSVCRGQEGCRMKQESLDFPLGEMKTNDLPAPQQDLDLPLVGQEEEQPVMMLESRVEQPEMKPQSPVEQPERKLESPVEQSETKSESLMEQPEMKLESPVEQPEIKLESPVEQPEIKPQSPVEQPEMKLESPLQQSEIRAESHVEQSEIRAESPGSDSWSVEMGQKKGEQETLECVEEESESEVGTEGKSPQTLQESLNTMTKEEISADKPTENVLSGGGKTGQDVECSDEAGNEVTLVEDVKAALEENGEGNQGSVPTEHEAHDSENVDLQTQGAGDSTEEVSQSEKEQSPGDAIQSEEGSEFLPPPEPEMLHLESSRQLATPSPDLRRARRSSKGSVTSEDPAASPRSLSPSESSEYPPRRQSRRSSRASVVSEDSAVSPTRSESSTVQSRPSTPSVLPHVGPPTPPVGGRSTSPSSSRTSTPTSETRRGTRSKRSDSQGSQSTLSVPRVRHPRAASPTVKRTSLRSYSPPPHYGTRRAGKGKPDKQETRPPGAPGKKPKVTTPSVTSTSRGTRGQKPAAVAPPARGRGKPAAIAQSVGKPAPAKRAKRGSKDEGPPSKRSKH